MSLDLRQWNFCNKRVLLSFLLFCTALVVISVMLPSVIFPTTSQQSIEDIRSQPMVVNNGSEYSFESDYTATIFQSVHLVDSESERAYFHSTVKYDADSERAIIYMYPNVSENNSERFQQKINIETYYYERNKQTGMINKYNLRQVYDSSNNSWVGLERNVYGETRCLLTDKKSVLKETASERNLQYDERLPFSSGEMALGVGSKFVELESSQFTDRKEITLSEGSYQPSFSSVFSGGFVSIRNSSGRVIGIEHESKQFGTTYEVNDSNLTATGKFYEGFLEIPVTKFWNGGMPIEIIHRVSDSHSEEVTVNRPAWVQSYKSDCESE